MRRAVLGVVALGLVLAGLAQRESPVRSPASGEPPGATTSDDVTDDMAADDSLGDTASAVGSTRRPRSLRGTRVDGGLVLDAAGHFLPTLETRRFFDYFLSATGEVDAEALRARIVAAIERRLPASEAPAAIGLLDQYLDYRARARALAQAPAAPADIGARLAQVARLRREVFAPAVVTAFFAAEEAAVQRELDRRAIASNPDLTFDERQRQLEALDASAPPDVRAARAAAVLATTLREEESRLREQGASPDDVRQLRERMVGPEAAERLAALDTQRAEWQSRVAGFQAERAQIMHDATKSVAERTTAIDALLASRFTVPERLRLQGLDEIAAAPGVAP